MHPKDPKGRNEYSADTCENFNEIEYPPGLTDYVLEKKIPWSEKLWNMVQNVSKKHEKKTMHLYNLIIVLLMMKHVRFIIDVWAWVYVDALVPWLLCKNNGEIYWIYCWCLGLSLYWDLSVVIIMQKLRWNILDLLLMCWAWVYVEAWVLWAIMQKWWWNMLDSLLMLVGCDM